MTLTDTFNLRIHLLLIIKYLGSNLGPNYSIHLQTNNNSTLVLYTKLYKSPHCYKPPKVHKSHNFKFLGVTTGKHQNLYFQSLYHDNYESR